MILSLLILGLIIIAIFSVLFVMDIFFSFYLSVPSLSSNRRSILKLLAKIDSRTAKNFYDLGSGNGRVLSQVAKEYPDLECIGIELNPVVYYWAVLRNLFSKNKITYLKKDFFDINLKEADIVYGFLFPGIMKKLESKFERELKKGAVVISSSFPMKGKRANEIIQGEKGTLDTLYIYRY